MTGVLGRKLGRTLLYGSLLAAGCSQQAWYEGFQASARQQCAALRSQSAIPAVRRRGQQSELSPVSTGTRGYP